MAGEPALVEQPGLVLVVEDDLIGRRTLERAVANHGHRAVTADDGISALEVMRSSPPDLVLLDLVMPRLDGFGVLDAMRADPDLADIPIVVISAVEDTESVARAIEMGAIDCLPKPFDPVMLRVRLRTALQQGRLRRLEQAYLRQELALRQNERLATLGRLSAGLAHELNNPAGAALRTVQQVGRHLDDVQATLEAIAGAPDAPTILSVSRSLLAAPRDRPVTRLERADHEDAIEATLAAAGLADAGPLAASLVEVGLEPDALSATITGLPPDSASLALGLLASRLAIRGGVERVHSSVQRISDIIGSLRSYSYLDQAPRQEVDVRAGISDTLTMLSHKVPAGVQVVRDDAGELPPVAALGPQLNQVWTNLIDNALDALGGSGTLTVRTRPTLGRSGPEVVVEVEDDGPGIPAEVQGRVFDPFVTTKEPGQGTGLGLNITHQIVTEGHDGRIEVASEPGRTRFTVSLPAAPLAEPTPEGHDG